MRSNTTEEPKTRIGVIIDNNILYAFREAVIQDGVSLSSCVNDLMNSYLENRKLKFTTKKSKNKVGA